MIVTIVLKVDRAIQEINYIKRKYLNVIFESNNIAKKYMSLKQENRRMRSQRINVKPYEINI